MKVIFPNHALIAACAFLLFAGCSPESKNMEKTELPDWKRPSFEAGGGNAFIIYAIYGSFTNEIKLSSSKYRTAGVPEGVNIKKVTRSESSPLPFTDGAFGQLLQKQNKSLFAQVTNAPECMIIQGEVVDPSSLNYLRECVGLVTYFLDHGGIAVSDVQQIKMFEPTDWRRAFFEPAQPDIPLHVVILISEEDIGTWYHTRGMRKFGRPDISLRHVPAKYQESAIDLCNRFIEMQALGGKIPDGHPITMKSLPAGLVCRHKGSLEDPDFNNVHVEIQFPKQ